MLPSLPPHAPHSTLPSAHSSDRGLPALRCLHTPQKSLTPRIRSAAGNPHPLRPDFPPQIHSPHQGQELVRSPWNLLTPRRRELVSPRKAPAPRSDWSPAHSCAPILPPAPSEVCPTPEIQTRPALRLVLETAPPATHSHLPARSLSACRKSARNLRSSPDRATAPEV